MLLAFVVFRKYYNKKETWLVVHNMVHPRASNDKKLRNSGRNYFLNQSAESWIGVMERKYGEYPFRHKVSYLAFTIIR